MRDIASPAQQDIASRAPSGVLVAIVRNAITNNEMDSYGIRPLAAMREITLRLRYADGVEKWALPLVFMGVILGALAMALVFISGSLYNT